MEVTEKIEILHNINHNGTLFEAGKVYDLDADTANTFKALRDPVSRQPIAREYSPEPPKKAEQLPAGDKGKQQK